MRYNCPLPRAPLLATTTPTTFVRPVPRSGCTVMLAERSFVGSQTSFAVIAIGAPPATAVTSPGFETVAIAVFELSQATGTVAPSKVAGSCNSVVP